MELLRTPDERFDNLPGYSFAPHYVELPDDDGATLRVHYVDEGPRTGRVVLLMHGEPSWSYLYRTMISPLVAAGYRVLAPDLVGFGRSDKPVAREAHSYARHVGWMRAWLLALDLREVNLFCQDWGSLIGLRLAAENEARFVRIAVGNGALPTGDQTLPDAFFTWLKLSQEVETFPVGAFLNGATITTLSPEIIAAYDAPFPDESYKAGARIFPTLVPSTPDDPAAPANRAAWEVLQRWNKPFLTTFSDSDPITRGGAAIFQKLVPGAKDQPHITIAGGGHFLQEDCGPQIAQVLIDWIGAK